jgi:HK97 family phage portal protein
MFDFLFRSNSGEVVSLLNLITANTESIKRSAFAYQKAVSMIAKAIAQSEIIITSNGERIHDELYYRLNVRPNDYQTATDFWRFAVDKMLNTEECLIVRVSSGEDHKFYVADSFEMTNEVLYEKIYKNVTITDSVNTLKLNRTFKASDVIHLKYESENLRSFTNSVLSKYDETLSAINTMLNLSNSPTFKYKTDSNAVFMTKDENGNPVRRTINDVLDNLTDKLKSAGVKVINEPNGTELKYMDISSKVSVSDLKSITEEIDETAAYAFDIPLGVFKGQISEKSDATNEFITYAVKYPAHVIEDALTTALIGKEDYVAKGERILIWLAHFKHKDIIDAAPSLDKLRSIGFTFDEVSGMVGYPPLNTEFSTSRALTKNYSTEELVESSDEDDGPEATDEPKESVTRHKLSKHKERRKRRSERTE